jgi:hypothetical protein
MDHTFSQSRRKVIKTGLAAAAGAVVTAGEAKADLPVPAPKKPGELKIVGAMGHEYMLETGIRPILGQIKNARIWWARHYGPITPELLSDTDLLLTYYFDDSFEWSPSGLADSRGKIFHSLYTDENVEAIIDNIENRGMGWMPIHNSIYLENDRLRELLGVEPILHREIQPVIIKNLNQNHPITKGMEPFVINLDEQFGIIIKKPEETTVLFKTLAVHDKRETIQGWCVQRGKGRIVGLPPGHYEWTWYEDAFKEILWRSAHWAMGMEIPPFPGNYSREIW